MPSDPATLWLADIQSRFATTNGLPNNFEPVLLTQRITPGILRLQIGPGALPTITHFGDGALTMFGGRY
jgi:hypothetical protein